MPRIKASKRDIIPAAKPLILAICIGSLSEMLRVRLLSIPQHIIAKIINNGPVMLNLPWLESQVKNIPAMVILTNANHKRFPAFSLKKKTAIMAVAIPSRFRSNDADKPEINVNPIIILIGPIIPPVSTAPASQGKSFLSNDTAFLARSIVLIFFTREYRDKPANAPRYRSPAKTTGAILLTSSLARGRLMPNKEADIMMYINELLFPLFSPACINSVFIFSLVSSRCNYPIIPQSRLAVSNKHNCAHINQIIVFHYSAKSCGNSRLSFPCCIFHNSYWNIFAPVFLYNLYRFPKILRAVPAFRIIERNRKISFCSAVEPTLDYLYGCQKITQAYNRKVGYYRRTKKRSSRAQSSNHRNNFDVY